MPDQTTPSSTTPSSTGSRDLTGVPGRDAECDAGLASTHQRLLVAAQTKAEQAACRDAVDGNLSGDTGQDPVTGMVGSGMARALAEVFAETAATYPPDPHPVEDDCETCQHARLVIDLAAAYLGHPAPRHPTRESARHLGDELA